VRGRGLRRASWAALAAVVAAALVHGSLPRPAPLTLSREAAQIAAGIKCPSCADVSVAQSDAPTAVAIRDYIRQALRRGQGRDQIDAYLASRYGTGILLNPPASGPGAAAYAVPAAAVLAAAAGLTLVFWRRRPSAEPALDPEGARMVEEALAARGEPP